MRKGLKVASQYDATPMQARRKNRNISILASGRRFGLRPPPTEVPFASYCEAALTWQQN